MNYVPELKVHDLLVQSPVDVDDDGGVIQPIPPAGVVGADQLGQSFLNILYTLRIFFKWI